MAGTGTSFLAAPAFGPRSAVPIRAAAGPTFLTQGILKGTDPRTGAVRFTRTGFPWPAPTARLVRAFEIAGGLLVLLGLLTGVAAIPLLIVIGTAVATTKAPEPARAGQGFRFMVSDGSTGFSMLCGLPFLFPAGPGAVGPGRARAGSAALTPQAWRPTRTASSPQGAAAGIASTPAESRRR